MNARILFSRALRGVSVIALAGAVAACASNSKIDSGTHHDLAVGPSDDLGVGEDLAAPDDAAASTDGGSCIQVATWPTTDVEAGFDDTYGDTYLFAPQLSGSTINLLDIGDYHLAMPETFPRSVSFSNADTEQNCDLCVNVCAGYDPNTGACTADFFVQSGSLTVDQADSDVNMGRFKVSGSNLKLVEWQDPSLDADGGIAGDKPVPNGQCWEIGSLSFDQPWGDMDGGVTDDGGDGGNTTGDGGANCHPVINEVQTAGVAAASDEFVEIYNPCSTSIDVSGWKLDYHSTNNNPSAAGPLYTFPASTMLAAGGYYLLGGSAYAGAVTPDASFTAGSLAAGGAGIGLLNGTTLIDAVSYGTLAVANDYTETAPAAAPGKGASISRHPNGADNDDNSKDFQVTATPTPKAANP